MSRFAALLCLLCLGCGLGLKPVVPPSPEPDVPVVADGTIDGISAAFNAGLRDAYRQSAANVRSGKWVTEEQLFDGETKLIDDAFDAAVQPLANRMQAEVGGKPLKDQADFRARIAEERQ